MSTPIPTTPIEQTPDQAAAVKAATGWVQNLARTLKTCRLYDASNPAVLRFRVQLHEALHDLLERHGTITFRFTSDDVLLEGESLYPARSRDDNLALAFFRDGVRSLTFSPGISPLELDVLVDGLLTVTGASTGEDDLVTLLWQANLTNLSVEHITAEGDIVGSTATDAPPVPWPTPATEEERAAAAADAPADAAPRSDDWDIGDATGDLESKWHAMHANITLDLQRFQSEVALERDAQPVPLALALATAYAAAEATPDDLAELARFLPRVLRIAVGNGEWRAAASAIQILERCGARDWSVVAFAQELNQPISVAGIVGWLDPQDETRLAQFIAFARLLQEPGVDLLHLVMVEARNPGHRSKLADAIVAACREQPERVAAWLADPREWVVANVVYMLARIGGPALVGLLRAVAQHHDPRVRLEVVNALRQADPEEARPVLARMLEDADTRTFCAVLQALSDRRDPAFALKLVASLAAPGFEQRPEEEKRSIYLALGMVAGDEVVSEVEAELHAASWFQRGPDPHRHALARCLARVGSPAAIAALERGARSKKPVVRKACEDALGTVASDG